MPAEPTSWQYAYAGVAFLIGGLSGFQGIYERYKHDSGRAILTVPGFIYLLSRGLVPAAVFIGLFDGGIIKQNLLLWSLGCGIALESVLRTRLYIKKSGGSGAQAGEIWRGLFDLVRWYQDLLLQAASSKLAEQRRAFVASLLPNPPPLNFTALHGKVQINLSSLPDPAKRVHLTAELKKINARFTANLANPNGTAANDIHSNYCHQLTICC